MGDTPMTVRDIAKAVIGLNYADMLFMASTLKEKVEAGNSRSYSTTRNDDDTAEAFAAKVHAWATSLAAGATADDGATNDD